MKVTVVGAGNVGATCAQRIAEADLADVYLVDVVEGLAHGKALDLAQAAPIVGHSRSIEGGEDWAGAAGSTRCFCRGSSGHSGLLRGCRSPLSKPAGIP